MGSYRYGPRVSDPPDPPLLSIAPEQKNKSKSHAHLPSQTGAKVFRGNVSATSIANTN